MAEAAISGGIFEEEEKPKESALAGIIQSFKDYYAGIVENKQMPADLLYMITYMTSLALARASRPELFASASERSEYVSSKYIKKVNILTMGWGFSYKESLEITADRVKNPLIKSLFNRFSNSIDSGVPDEEFLSNELVTTRMVYVSNIEQGFELLKKWGDAYIAMLLSSAVVAVTMMISVAIYAPTGIDMTLNMSYALTLGISIFGIVLMYKSVPDDPKTHGLDTWRSKEQISIRKIERIMVPIVAIIALIMVAFGVNAGFICLFIGLMMGPLGIIGFIDDTNISQRDDDFSVFIRSLGSVMQGQGATLPIALDQVDKKSLVALEPLVRSVHSKMNLGLEEEQIWERFIGESGSNLIYKYLNIFRDTVATGGPAGEIGKVVGNSMQNMVLLRQKRDMLAKSFIILLIPMHVMMVGILVALFNIMLTLTTAITSMMEKFAAATATSGVDSGMGGNAFLAGSLNMFVNFPKDVMTNYVVIIMMILSISNVLAAKIVWGGDRYMYYFYIAIFFTLSGLIYLILPSLVGMFFSVDVLTNISNSAAANTT
jgi:flagellar protein FlaJ